MARMYSRKRGKSGSSKPLTASKASWVRYKAKEVELLIVKLAKEGKNSAAIGTTLRDSYGIPDVKSLTNKRITQILSEKKLTGDLPEDILSLMKRAVIVRKHLVANHKDRTAKRGMQLTEAKINRLAKYYKKTKKLPVDWKYDPDKIRLVTE